MQQEQQSSILLQKIALIAVFMFPILLIATWVAPKQQNQIPVVKSEGVLRIETEKKEYKTGEEITLKIKNQKTKAIFVQLPCTGLPEMILLNDKQDNISVGHYNGVECISRFEEFKSGEERSIKLYPEIYKIASGKKEYQFLFKYSKEPVDREVLTALEIGRLPRAVSAKLEIENLLENIDDMNKNLKIEKSCISGLNQSCEVAFSHCDCAFHCVRAESEIDDCDRECKVVEIQREMKKCGCVEGRCKEVEYKTEEE